MIHLEAEHDMLIDGKVLADGSDATYTGAGGGSGGSIYLKARFLSGMYDKGTHNCDHRYNIQQQHKLLQQSGIIQVHYVMRPIISHCSGFQYVGT